MDMKWILLAIVIVLLATGVVIVSPPIINGDYSETHQHNIDEIREACKGELTYSYAATGEGVFNITCREPKKAN